MRLLGVFEKNYKEMFMLQEKNLLFLKEKELINNNFENYELIKNRDISIKTEDIEGEGIFNFRYGPITGGVADAGVFNIKTYGERILAVDIDPSYKKRNMENFIKGLEINKAIPLVESVCANFAFSHSTAFLRAVEDALNIQTDEFTKRVRIIGVELERIYNHLYIILKLSKGASQNVLTSHLESLFEETLRINKAISNSRFLKNLNGLVIRNNKLNNLDYAKDKINYIKNKFQELYEHSLESWNFIDRIYKTATLTQNKALEIGVTGPTLRATGSNEDLRQYEHLYENLDIQTQTNGDSLSRMIVRAKEIINSCDIILNQIDKISNIKIKQKTHKISSGMGLGYCESPSGIVAYFIELKDSTVSDIYISTPSVFGFKAFAESLIGYIFTDFSFAYDSFGVNFADCAR